MTDELVEIGTLMLIRASRKLSCPEFSALPSVSDREGRRVGR